MAKVLIGNVYPSHAYLMERCAPAGFGLGGNGQLVEISSIAELDSLSNNGWYDIHSSNELTLGGVSFTACVLEISSLSETYGWQIIRLLGKNSTLIRHKNNGVWGEWEWDNPALYAGIEYRTTERFRGEPVYVKLVDCAGMPSANNTKTVDHGITPIRYIVDFGGYMMPENMNVIALPYRFSSTNYAYLSVDSKKIQLESGATDLAAYTDVKVWIKYTKSTN